MAEKFPTTPESSGSTTERATLEDSIQGRLNVVDALKKLIRRPFAGRRGPGADHEPSLAERRRARRPVVRHPDRRAGYYVNPHSWPTNLGELAMTSDEAIEVLDEAFTPENWAASKQNLRETAIEGQQAVRSLNENSAQTLDPTEARDKGASGSPASAS